MHDGERRQAPTSVEQNLAGIGGELDVALGFELGAPHVEEPEVLLAHAERREGDRPPLDVQSDLVLRGRHSRIEAEARRVAFDFRITLPRGKIDLEATRVVMNLQRAGAE